MAAPRLSRRVANVFRRLCEDTSVTPALLNAASNGFCQVNDTETAQPIAGYIPFLLGHVLGARHLLPFTKRFRAKLPIVNRSRQMSAQPEQISYNAINRKKALSLSR